MLWMLQSTVIKCFLRKIELALRWSAWLRYHLKSQRNLQFSLFLHPTKHKILFFLRRSTAAKTSTNFITWSLRIVKKVRFSRTVNCVQQLFVQVWQAFISTSKFIWETQLRVYSHEAHTNHYENEQLKMRCYNNQMVKPTKRTLHNVLQNPNISACFWLQKQA